MPTSDTNGHKVDIDQVRTEFQTSLGQVVSVLTAIPRYSDCRLSDIVKLVLEPLATGHIVVARPQSAEKRSTFPGGVIGILIWAKASNAVDRKIRRHVERGTFPIVLEEADWNSGSICWILDLVAPDGNQAATILRKHLDSMLFESIKLHPHVTALLGVEGLAKANLTRDSLPYWN